LTETFQTVFNTAKKTPLAVKDKANEG